MNESVLLWWRAFNRGKLVRVEYDVYCGDHSRLGLVAPDGGDLRLSCWIK